MPDIQFFKETTLPTTREPHSLYMVGPAERPELVELYVTAANPAVVRRVIDQALVQAMIDTAIAAGTGGSVIVDTIAERDALSASNAQSVLVIDASADPTVTAGAAYYVYRESNDTWVKISEAEGLDNLAPLTNRVSALETDLGELEGTVGGHTTAISGLEGRMATVETAATHANRSQLNEIGEDAQQNLTYRGLRPKVEWDSTGW